MFYRSKSVARPSARLFQLLVLGLLTGIAQASSIKLEAGVEEALAARGELRVIISPQAGLGQERAAQTMTELFAAVPALQARVARKFDAISAVAVAIDASTLASLRSSGLSLRVELDEGGSGSLVESRPLAQVTAAHLAGLSGAGQKLVILDSGLRNDHLSFAGRIVDQACFCATVPDGSAGCCPNGQRDQFGPGAAMDDHGHGTNVGGIAVGADGVNGVPRGVASAADIVAVKVLTSTNSFFFTSEILAAYEWVRINHPDAVVVNASLGTNARFAGDCDTGSSLREGFATNFAALRAQGTLTTVSSGNNGVSGEMQLPACSSAALSVAAVYDSAFGSSAFGSVCSDPTTAADQMTCFSNLSATTDLSAPGALLTAAGLSTPNATSTMQGTSMAAPMVAGCIALLREAVPTATPSAIEAALEASPTRIARPGYAFDYPRLDCADALIRLLPEAIFADGFESP